MCSKKFPSSNEDMDKLLDKLCPSIAEQCRAFGGRACVMPPPKNDITKRDTILLSLVYLAENLYELLPLTGKIQFDTLEIPDDKDRDMVRCFVRETANTAARRLIPYISPKKYSSIFVFIFVRRAVDVILMSSDNPRVFAGGAKLDEISKQQLESNENIFYGNESSHIVGLF